MDGSRASEDRAAVLDHRLQTEARLGDLCELLPKLVLLCRRVDLGSDGHLDHAFEQAALTTKRQVDRFRRDPGRICDRRDRRPRVAAVGKQPIGDVEYPSSVCRAWSARSGDVRDHVLVLHPSEVLDLGGKHARIEAQMQRLQRELVAPRIGRREWAREPPPPQRSRCRRTAWSSQVLSRVSVFTGEPGSLVGVA